MAMEDNRREFKGVWIPAEIWEWKQLSWNEKILLAEIDSFTSKNRDCFFSNEYISVFLDVGVRMVKKYIHNLKKEGLIEQVRFDGRKRYLRSLLTVKKGNKELTSSLPQKKRGECTIEVNHSSRQGGTIGPGRGEPQFPHTNTPTNTVKIKNISITSDDFARFWAEVPTGRRMGKKKCLAKVSSVINSGEATLDELVGGMRDYAAYCRRERKETRYIKLPETWVSKGCWDDEYDTVADDREQSLIEPVDDSLTAEDF